jgi:hypothetical protein
MYCYLSIVIAAMLSNNTQITVSFEFIIIIMIKH